MARKPDRLEPKRHLQLNIENNVYRKMQQLFLAPHGPFESFSEITETLLFLSIAAYHEEPGDTFVRHLLKVKAIKELSAEDLTKAPKVKRLHVYVDVEALRFLDELVATFPVVCQHRKDALELIYCYAILYCAKAKAHFLSRLSEVRLHHP